MLLFVVVSPKYLKILPRRRIICYLSFAIAEKWCAEKDIAVSSCASREKTSQNHRL